MMEKAYSLFLCILLISVVFLPSTAAGRVLLHTAQTEGEGGHHGRNDGNKIGVTGSRSNTAPSKSGSSSPSEPTPTGPKHISYGDLQRKPAAVCNANIYRNCIPLKNQVECTRYKRNC